MGHLGEVSAGVQGGLCKGPEEAWRRMNQEESEG